MATRKARSFSELYGSNASHENAKSLKEKMDALFTVWDIDFGRSQYGKVSYLLIGEMQEGAEWHYTTSQVILSQLSELDKKNPCPFTATLRERNNYLVLE